LPHPADSRDELTAYEKFYRLCARPFSLTPDLRFTYPSQSHSSAFDRISEALRHRDGVIVVTGEIGTGKTMLCRALLETFKEARTFLCVILDPKLGVDDLLYRILADFGVAAPGDRATSPGSQVADRHRLVSTLQQFLASLVPLHAHAVVMIDEAQHLSPEVLEQLRLLANFETDGAKLLQIILVGQPDLDDLLRRPELQALNQRIERRIALQPLSDREVSEYIERRLEVAACHDGDGIVAARTVAFDATAIQEVGGMSGGVPRAINTLCDRALEVGAGRQAHAIDGSIVVAAADALGISAPTVSSAAPRTASRAPIAVAAAVLLVALVVWRYWPTSTSSNAAPPVVTTPTPAPPAPRPAAEPPPAERNPDPPRTAGSAAPTAAAAPTGRYRIVVAAFRTSKRAQDVAAEISSGGLNATIVSDTESGWQQVVVGPFATSDEAESAQELLERRGYRDTRLVAPPPSGG
jgi:general secretion pathway protein A